MEACWKDREHFKKYVQISEKKSNHIGYGRNFILIWPEGALSFYHKSVSSAIYSFVAISLGEPTNKEKFINDIKNENNKPSNAINGIIMFPSVIIEGEEDDEEKKLFNGITVINQKGQEMGIYKKRHPVPFGEYIPLRKFMPKPLEFLIGIGDILPSRDPIKHIVYKGVRIMPVICFDIIFDDNWTEYGQKPDIAINVSNDAWLDGSLGFYQHFALVKMRAAISQTPILRVANSGITAYIDKYGRVIKQIPKRKIDSIDICLNEDVK